MVVALVMVVLGDPWKGVLVWGSRAVVGGDPWKGVVVRVCGGGSLHDTPIAAHTASEARSRLQWWVTA